jgi:glycosyltransferase involved in cell wall biosynthesis
VRVGLIADPVDNQRAGIHVYTREMLRALSENKSPGDQLIVVREKEVQPEPGVESIALPNIRWGLGLSALRLLFVVPAVFRRKNADVVIEPAHFGPFFLSKRQKRITVIHDLTPILMPEYHNWHSQWLQHRFLKGILRRADVIVANSMHTARDIMKYYPAGKMKVAVIYPGIDPEFAPAEAPDRIDKWSLEQKGYWFFAGTVEPRKNLIKLVEAYELFRDRHPDSSDKLVITGQKGWKSDPVYAVVDQSPRKSDIVLTGYVAKPDLVALYTYARGTVYPSLYEGFGFPVLEAFACGCPVVCSEGSSLPEVGGDLAFYADPASAASICQQMEKIQNLTPEGRHTLSLKAQEYASGFTWERFGEEWWAVLRGLLP